MTTKRELVSQAYGELALQGYVFDLDPEELQWALVRLEGLMGTWDNSGLRLGYAFSSQPDLDQESGIPTAADEAAYMALAKRIAAGKGKQLAQSTKVAAKEAYDALVLWALKPEPIQFAANMPRGAGQKSWRRQQDPYFPTPDTSPVQIDNQGLEFLS